MNMVQYDTSNWHYQSIQTPFFSVFQWFTNVMMPQCKNSFDWVHNQLCTSHYLSVWKWNPMSANFKCRKRWESLTARSGEYCLSASVCVRTATKSSLIVSTVTQEGSGHVSSCCKQLPLDRNPHHFHILAGFRLLFRNLKYVVCNPPVGNVTMMPFICQKTIKMISPADGALKMFWVAALKADSTLC